MSYTLMDLQEANKDRLGGPLPPEAAIFIHPGCFAELMLLPDEAGSDQPPQAAWVRVTQIRARDYTGILDSQPVPGMGLPDAGAQVTFEWRHVKAVMPPKG